MYPCLFVNTVILETIETCLRQPFSYLALSKESRELIGMRLSCIMTRPDPGQRFVIDEEYMRTYSHGLQEVLRLDAHLLEKVAAHVFKHVFRRNFLEAKIAAFKQSWKQQCSTLECGECGIWTFRT